MLLLGSAPGHVTEVYLIRGISVFLRVFINRRCRVSFRRRFKPERRHLNEQTISVRGCLIELGGAEYRTAFLNQAEYSDISGAIRN